ncbi:MAG: hypothetical protein U0136_21615 [Bdellovibrionota bacterium]
MASNAPKIVALVIDGQSFEDEWLQETAQGMRYGTGLSVERRVQRPQVFADITSFRQCVERVLGEPDVQAVAFIFPPTLADEYNISQATSGAHFTWDVVGDDSTANVSSMSALHDGLIIYGRTVADPK